MPSPVRSTSTPTWGIRRATWCSRSLLGLIKVYQRNASGPPFYTLVGSTTASSALAGIAAWALSGNDDELPAAKFPFPIPDWLSDPVGSDIPFSLLESTLVEMGSGRERRSDSRSEVADRPSLSRRRLEWTMAAALVR